MLPGPDETLLVFKPHFEGVGILLPSINYRSKFNKQPHKEPIHPARTTASHAQTSVSAISAVSAVQPGSLAFCLCCSQL